MGDSSHAQNAQPVTAAAGSTAGKSQRLVFTRLLRDAGIGIALLLLILFFSLTTTTFLTPNNLTNIMVQITINVILAAGMTFVILIGGIDLSVGSVMALAGVISGTIMTSGVMPDWAAILAAVLCSCAIGAAVGVFNGAVSAWWGIPSFIVTLGMLNLARGAALQFTQSNTIYNFPSSFNYFGTIDYAGVPILFLVALAIVAVGWVLLTKTVFGRMLYAIGNNEEAVRLAGHNTFVYKTAAFAICGFTVGIAALMYMARLSIASPIMGNGFELNAIAAVIIGGSSLNGGRGSLIGTLLGAAIIGVLANGLILIGATDFIRQMITGGVIILAVILDAYRARLADRSAA